MANTRTNIPNVVDPALNAVFADVLEEYQPSYTQVAKVIQSSTDQEEYLDTTGMGELSEKTEGASVDFDNLLEGYKTTIVNATFSRGLRFSLELIEDNKFNQVLDATRAQMRSFVRTRDHAFWGLFNSGFNTSFTSYGDAKPLFSTTHTRKDGGSNQSNASSTGIVLSETNLETGLLAMREILDHKGQPKMVGWGRVQLVVPPSLGKEAVEITQSELQAGSANNNLNWYKGQNVDVLVVPWLSATLGTAWNGGTAGVNTNWFLVDPLVHSLVFQNRSNPVMESQIDFDTKESKNSIVTRFGTGWTGWWGAWGSKGDGASYTS